MDHLHRNATLMKHNNCRLSLKWMGVKKIDKVNKAVFPKLPFRTVIIQAHEAINEVVYEMSVF